jgi:preprotein translocase subunit SecG
MGVADVLLIIVSIVLITLVVVQNSKDDASNAFSGEKSDLFSNKKERGFELMLSRITLGASALFIILAIWAMTGL